MNLWTNHEIIVTSGILKIEFSVYVPVYYFFKEIYFFVYFLLPNITEWVYESENLFCDIPTETIKVAFHILPKNFSGKSSTLHDSPLTWY